MENQLVWDGEGAVGTVGGRIDWRTGKRMMARDDGFWQQHEALRREQGLSIPQYCESNGLALSTFRHRVGRLVRAEAVVEQEPRAKSKSTDARGQFIALPHGAPPSSGNSEIEVHLPGSMTLHLHGAAAQQVLDRILAQLP